MRSVLAVASIATLAAIASAQTVTGYGRFPCTTFVGGIPTADGNQCFAVTAPGTGLGGGEQGDGPAPIIGTCSLEVETGNFFCGIAGAACSLNNQCDNGYCSSNDGRTPGTCQGGFGQTCNGVDSNCSGYLYCTGADLLPTVSGTCGGLGAFCQDYTVGDSTMSDAYNEALFNQFCQSGYCAFNTGNCAEHVGPGGDCSFDPEFACEALLTCVTDTTTGAQSCQTATASGRARARARRSDDRARRNVCPSSHSACLIPGAKGFECIDTSSNIEQCGACASDGGVDCTQIDGVAAVGCVAGVCEIWSCADGFTYDAAKGACVA